MRAYIDRLKKFFLKKPATRSGTNQDATTRKEQNFPLGRAVRPSGDVVRVGEGVFEQASPHLSH
jgi:hypothetical protein